MNIYGLTKTTLLDYPGLLACTIFTGGCNMRCRYCHNSALVLNPASNTIISETELFEFLEKRKNLLQGICISGGEPTLSPDLISFIKNLKSTGLKIKLDTNGLNPYVLEELLSEKLLNMVAMDIKSSLDTYETITGVPDINKSLIEKSARLLLSSTDIDYEFRTTVPAWFFSVEDMKKIGSWLMGARAYFLQAYKKSDSCMTQEFDEPSYIELKALQAALLEFIPNTQIRGISMD